jgi:hypothetical protein
MCIGSRNRQLKVQGACQKHRIGKKSELDVFLNDIQDLIIDRNNKQLKLLLMMASIDESGWLCYKKRVEI